MLKQVTIKGFKGITNLTLNLNKINVLIGANSSGKTTILQALDLLSNCAFKDIPEYLKDKGWKVSDIKSQISKDSFLSYKSIFEFQLNQQPFILIWNINFKFHSTGINLIEENIFKVNSKQDQLLSNSKNLEKLYQKANLLYSYKDGIVNYGIYTDQNSKISKLAFPFSLSSSSLKIINFSNKKEILLLKNYLSYMSNFGILITENMRKSYIGVTENIGIGGEQLATFIKQMTPKQRKSYIQKIHLVLSNMEGISAVTKGSSNWIELIIKEKFGSNDIKVNSYHISDGTLRILAFFALFYIKYDYGLLMVDEIENGLDPHIVTKIVELYYEFTSQTHNQLLLTTHSTLMLDDFKPEDIIYVYRNQDGSIGANRVFNNKKVKEFLKYMYPGEIWININEKELLESNSN